jgi:hypothetical protein
LDGVFGGNIPPEYLLRFVFVVVQYDFLNDEIQKVAGKFGVEVRLLCKLLKTGNLGGFAGRIGRWKAVLCFELANGLSVLEPLAQRVDKNRIEPVNAGTVVF